MKYVLKHLQSLVAVALCVVMAMAFTSCGDDDDEPEDVSAKEAMLQGTWKCTDYDITSIKATGFELPDYVADMMKDAIADDMDGYVLTIPDFSTGQVKLKDDVLIFPGSGIQYKIKSLNSQHMQVTYETSTTVTGFTIEMTVVAWFDKIR